MRVLFISLLFRYTIILFLILCHHISIAFYVSTVVVQFIALYCTYVHKPCFILSVCCICLVSIPYTGLFDITCIHALLALDSSSLYQLTGSRKFVTIEGSSHIYETRLLATSQMVNYAIHTAFVQYYCFCLHVFYSWLSCYLPLTHILYITTLSFTSC